MFQSLLYPFNLSSQCLCYYIKYSVHVSIDAPNSMPLIQIIAVSRSYIHALPSNLPSTPPVSSFPSLMLQFLNLQVIIFDSSYQFSHSSFAGLLFSPSAAFVDSSAFSWGVEVPSSQNSTSPSSLRVPLFTNSPFSLIKSSTVTALSPKIYRICQLDILE